MGEHHHPDSDILNSYKYDYLDWFDLEGYKRTKFIHKRPVKIELLYPDAKIPTRGTELRAYYDVYSYEDIEFKPEVVHLVHTGIKVQAPPGYFIDIRPRSGLAAKGLTINNSPGTCDCDYGGELMIELIWHTPNERDWLFPGHKISKGDRIAQINVMPMYEIEFIESHIEGTAGFGSTGK